MSSTYISIWHFIYSNHLCLHEIYCLLNEIHSKNLYEYKNAQDTFSTFKNSVGSEKNIHTIR